jgi:endoglucanase
MLHHQRRITIGIALFLVTLGIPLTARARERFVTTRGGEFITPDGRSLLLKGINLGNWLLPEGYMFKFK